MGISFGSQLTGRVILEEVTAGGKVIAKKYELLNKKKAQQIEAAGIDKLKVRSVISCKSRFGVCQQCYGYDLGRNKLVEKGEAVGIVTAQAIGEPGTQLTLRTFHTGGVAGGADITQGLPRVEELFESRIPKGKAALSELNGKVIDIKDHKGQKIITIEGSQELKGKKKKKVSKEYIVPLQTGIWVQKNDEVSQGQQLWEGSVDLKELFKLAGLEPLQRYIIKEIQGIYSTQGEGLNNKHIELIIHQMLSRVRVKDKGETNLLAGAIIEKDIFFEANDKAKKAGKKPATAAQILMGITKVALSTESFLSAASFMETVRVLIKAASEGRVDHLRGLKENVIIGKLIPAGTGYREMMEEKEWEEREKEKK
jgi:DNA-directed RNA polymerase subunit beta'